MSNSAVMNAIKGSDAGDRRHTISLKVANRPGVLIRIALVFSRRGYNLDSLVVSPSSDPEFSMMNLVATGDEKVLDQILKQLNKLIDVVHATDRTGQDIVTRELALLKIRCDQKERAEILQLASTLKSEVVDIVENSLTVQVTGSSERVDAVIRVFEPYDIFELVRTGKVLMARGAEVTA